MSPYKPSKLNTPRSSPHTLFGSYLYLLNVVILFLSAEFSRKLILSSLIFFVSLVSHSSLSSPLCERTVQRAVPVPTLHDGFQSKCIIEQQFNGQDLPHYLGLVLCRHESVSCRSQRFYSSIVCQSGRVLVTKQSSRSREQIIPVVNSNESQKQTTIQAIKEAELILITKCYLIINS